MTLDFDIHHLKYVALSYFLPRVKKRHGALRKKLLHCIYSNSAFQASHNRFAAGGLKPTDGTLQSKEFYWLASPRRGLAHSALRV